MTTKAGQEKKLSRGERIDPSECLLIQWEQIFLVGGELACPRCHAPAAMCLGAFGNPCYAHVPRKRKDTP